MWRNRDVLQIYRRLYVLIAKCLLNLLHNRKNKKTIPMKLKLAFILLLAISIYSCGDSESAKDNIEIPSKKVYIWEGENSVVEIKTTLSSPTLKIDDTDIAQVEFKDNSIHISTFKTGSTTVYISDLLHNEASFSVIVGSIQQGIWEEKQIGIYQSDVEILAENQNAALELKATLKEGLINQLGSTYTFDENDNNLEIMHIDKDNNVVKYIGTYEYDKIKSILVLNYNDITELFTLYPIEYHGVRLEQDLTELYKLIYPNYGISKVLTTRYLIKPKNL
ncbi:hypothetical protein D0T53_10855 [Dysgonomonas sp. 216]|nr:hypothetical protein [Dysgonomonas sp. 216]